MFKSVFTFARKAMKKSNQMKTTISPHVVILGLLFCTALLLVLGSASVEMLVNRLRVLNIEVGEDLTDSIFLIPEESDNHKFLIVNAPDDFIVYLDEAKTIDDSFDYATAELESPYDFINCGKLMHEAGACSAAVFPSTGDLYLSSGEPYKILTYSLTDDLDNDIAEEHLKSILGDYSTYVHESKGLPTPKIESSTPVLYAVPFKSFDRSLIGIVGVVPLVIFIFILFCVMTGGTNVIAGEKERGTFAAVILTPVPRSSIVIGDIFGISVLALIPSLILCLVIHFYNLISGHQSLVGLLIAFLLVITFTWFAAALTVLISVLNRSIISAQTAFLPIFLLMLGIGVTCIQKLGVFEKYLLYFPIYGHFFGIGNALAVGWGYFESYKLAALTCCLITLLLTVGLVALSSALLKNERFMTNAGGVSAREIKKASRKSIANFDIGPILHHTLFPIVVLSVVQLLALIPTAIKYMQDAAFADFISNLQNVETMTDLIGTVSEIFATFMNDPVFLISMTFGYVLLVLIYCLRIRIFEKNPHPLQGLCFTGSRPLIKYLVGLLLGFTLLSSVCLILILTGNLTFNGLGVNSSNCLVILSGIPMWFIQGASEEIMFRGYMIPRLTSKYNKIFAVIFSSFLFAVFHGANIGFTPLAGINLFLIAVMFALIYLLTDSIWITCAAHTAWNFCQGSLYGLEVSGSTSGASVIASSYTSKARAFMTGGAFGPEGGLAVTIVTLVAMTIVIFLMWRKGMFSKSKSADLV